ncbi:MAG: ArgR family transcriptional regulator [Bacteroidales bacterium]|nr:ArgR family transcriptional regulator [Bacteroidales bacterium]MBQ7818129.1 ArgR family transcriptional regulator [Bacteroidales bacterium]
MKNKVERIQKIKEIISSTKIESQGQLLDILIEEGYDLTQATLSRDLKRMRIAKVGDGCGGYSYILPGQNVAKTLNGPHPSTTVPASNWFVSIDFSGQFCVIKTRPGYAGGIALDIDAKEAHQIMGTIAGDDTILVILRGGVRKKELTNILKDIIPIID